MKTLTRLMLCATLLGQAALADTPITPALIVNGQGISGYEIDQRMAFLAALGQQGDLMTQAREALISDRLQSFAAQQLDLTVSPAEIEAGMDEFAARAKMTREQFIGEMAKAGVDPETFRDFVKAGSLWRKAARAKFAGKVEVSEAEVDRALGQGASASTERRLLLSELVIPASEGVDPAALAGRVRMAIKSQADFARMAKQFSKAGTARSGGELGWVGETQLPPQVASEIGKLHAGEMTQVVALDGAAALYFLRDEGAMPGSGPNVVDYAVVQGPQASALVASTMGCDALYPAGRSGMSVTRQTLPEAQLPRDLGAAIAALDPGEARDLQPGKSVVLCSRVQSSGAPLARAAVRNDLVNRKVEILAGAWSEELRFDAYVETP
jgi:peptidyl-prolyl cis-trans isomerase SurA